MLPGPLINGGERILEAAADYFHFRGGSAEEPSGQKGSPIQARRAHVDHSASGHGGGRGVVDVVRLEDDFAVRRHGQTVPVGQRQRPVVVQHRVEVLDPQRIHRAVQDEPNVLSTFCSQRFAPQGRKDSVRPDEKNVNLDFFCKFGRTDEYQSLVATSRRPNI